MQEVIATDASDFMGENYLDVATVKASKTKRIRIEAQPTIEQTTWGRKLQCKALLDGIEYVWKFNQKTVGKLVEKYGLDPRAWAGRELNLEVEQIKGNDSIIGYPL